MKDDISSSFEDIHELNSEFIHSIDKLPKQLKVSGYLFSYLTSSVFELNSFVEEGETKGYIVYHLHPTMESKRDLDSNNQIKDRLVFIWKILKNKLIPYSVKFTTKQGLVSAVIKESSTVEDKNTPDIQNKEKYDVDSEKRIANAKAEVAEFDVEVARALGKEKIKSAKTKTIRDINKLKREEEEVIRQKHEEEEERIKNNITGTTEVELVLLGINDNQAIPAKVDTGADLSSLHATEIQQSSSDNGTEMVVFNFNNKVYKMNLDSSQPISSSDGGTEHRPVVKFNIKLGDKQYDNISFNLNDRSEMEYKILLGVNALEELKLKIEF